MAPCFKFGLNPSLIDGILNVFPYEQASKWIMKSQKMVMAALKSQRYDVIYIKAPSLKMQQIK